MDKNTTEEQLFRIKTINIVSFLYIQKFIVHYYLIYLTFILLLYSQIYY